MGKGRTGIPLHEAEEYLRQQVEASSSTADPRRGDIELDTSPEAAALPVTEVGTGRLREINSIWLDEPGSSERQAARREADLEESYEVLKEMYLTGELTASEIEEIFLAQPRASFLKVVEAKKREAYTNSDEVAAGRILDEIHGGKLRPPTQGWRPAEGGRPAPKLKGERWADQHERKAFLALCQEYVKGMPTAAIKQQFFVSSKDRLQRAATIDFLKRLNHGFNPSAYLMNEILLVQPGLKEKELTQQDWQQANERFLQATREVWGPFVYSGKWQRDKKTDEYKLTEDADLDAKTSLLLLNVARLEQAKRGKLHFVAPGEYQPGATTIDSGLRSGVAVERSGTVVIDNHQRTRGYETSSAKILYNLLRARGDVRETGSLRALVEHSVLDDNARLLTTRKQFDKSDRTLRGLHRYMSASRLLEYYEGNWARASNEVRRRRHLATGDRGGASGAQVMEYILDHELTERELRQWKLGAAAHDQRRTVARAHELLFDVPEDKLVEQGRVVASKKLGKVVVNIEGMGDKRFLGGHDAVFADSRFDGYLSWDEAGQSLLINTTKRDLDLSVAFKGLLDKYSELVCVRGALIIKPRNGKPLPLGFKDLLAELGVDSTQAKGQVKQYLEYGLPRRGTQPPTRRGRESAPPPVPAPPAEQPKPAVPEAQLAPPLAPEAVPAVPPTETKEALGGPGMWVGEQPPAAPEESAALAPEAAAEPVPPTYPVETSQPQPGQPPAAEALAPPTEAREPKAERWTDETGIAFSRELTAEEQRVKDEIDDMVRTRLAARALDLLQQPEFADEANREAFVDSFVEDGLRHAAVVEKRAAQYHSRGLPVVEQRGSGE